MPDLSILRGTLERFAHFAPDRQDDVDRYLAFMEARPDCLRRSCEVGHITASAWIIDPTKSRFLLTHHRKLDRWLQLGGHVDGEPDPAAAAVREAKEESGFDALDLIKIDGAPLPIDLDVHRIPARKTEPAHNHWDVRYLLVARVDEPVIVSDESHDVKWFDRSEIESVTNEESVLRLDRRADWLMALAAR